MKFERSIFSLVELHPQMSTSRYTLKRGGEQDSLRAIVAAAHGQQHYAHLQVVRKRERYRDRAALARQVRGTPVYRLYRVVSAATRNPGHRNRRPTSVARIAAW